MVPVILYAAGDIPVIVTDCPAANALIAVYVIEEPLFTAFVTVDIKVGPDFIIKPLLSTSGIVIVCGATVKLLAAFNKAALEDVDPIGP
jgi:hypothetical protein